MLGELLSDAREKAGLTLKELAAKTGTSFQYLSKLEHDRGEPSLGTLRRLDRALELPTSTLVKMIRGCQENTHLVLGLALLLGGSAYG